jgi:hypothetical protein
MATQTIPKILSIFSYSRSLQFFLHFTEKTHRDMQIVREMTKEKKDNTKIRMEKIPSPYSPILIETFCLAFVQSKVVFASVQPKVVFTFVQLHQGDFLRLVLVCKMDFVDLLVLKAIRSRCGGSVSGR